ncbi:MAG: glycosyltransferase family 2 protein [Solirubrobacteraceae bacterium]
MSPTLTVGIASYNGRELLEIVLPSLLGQTLRDFHTVVVDDGSSDDSVAWLRREWPEVEVIAHASNRGVTAALNECLRASESEFVALLNNDVELHPDCLAELLDTLRREPAAGVACAKLIDYHDRARLDGAGDIYTWRGEAHRRGQGELDEGQYDREQDIFSACGATAVYRRSAIADVGIFDERFFANYEDVDWCFRAQLKGHTCRYVPSATAYHMGSATLGKGLSDFALYHNWRNGIWVIAKNWPLPLLLRHLPELAFQQLYNLGVALRARRPRIWLRAWADALRGMRVTLDGRREVQRSRRRSWRELELSIELR